MKKIPVIILILSIISGAGILSSQNLSGEAPASTLPSEETYKNIENSSAPPNLRAAPPGETGNPQGHVPTGNTSRLATALFAIAFLTYKQYKTKPTKR